MNMAMLSELYTVIDQLDAKVDALSAKIERDEAAQPAENVVDDAYLDRLRAIYTEVSSMVGDEPTEEVLALTPEA